MTEATSIRKFCYMLSPEEGDLLAKEIGYLGSSPDNHSMEMEDSKVKIMMLLGTGLYQSINTTARWMAEVYSAVNSKKLGIELTPTERENAEALFTSFGGALVSHLLDQDKLVLSDSVFIAPEVKGE
jgi:hypothetical protein